MRNLKVMQQLFYQPMRDDPAIPADFVELLFPNIDDMIELHGESVVAVWLHCGLLQCNRVQCITSQSPVAGTSQCLASVLHSLLWRGIVSCVLMWS